MAIEQVTARNLEELLPLVAAYQRFYQVETVDDERNRAFFGRFARDEAPGVQFLYRADEGRERRHERPVRVADGTQRRGGQGADPPLSRSRR